MSKVRKILDTTRYREAQRSDFAQINEFAASSSMSEFGQVREL